MGGTSSWTDRLSPLLFWDVDQNNIDAAKHARWILERVLERGQWEDWLLLVDNLGNDTIASLAQELHVDYKARNFLEHWLCRS